MKVSTVAILSLTSIALNFSCGKKSDDDAPRAKQDENKNGEAGNSPSGTPTTTPGQVKPGVVPVSGSTFEVKSQQSFVTSRSVNGRQAASFAFFIIKPNSPGLNVQSVTLNGNPITTSSSGFGGAKILQGKLDAQVLKTMFNDRLVGLTDAEKAQLLEQHKDGLYFYSENHSFDFQQDGVSNKIKLIIAKDSTKVGEHEFTL